MLENLKNTSLWIFEVQSEGYLLSGSGVNVVFKFSTLPTGRPDMKINRGASEKDMDISDLLAQQSLAGHSWEVGSRVYPYSCTDPNCRDSPLELDNSRLSLDENCLIRGEN